MRAREFIVREQVAATLAAPVTAPVKAAGREVVDKGIDAAKTWGKEFISAQPGYAKGTMGNIDKAIDAVGYSQGANLKAGQSVTPVDFATDQAVQRGIGTTAKVAGDKATQALVNKGIETGVKTWAPRALSFAGNAFKTGTGPVGTALAIGAGHKDLGPETPKVGPYRGDELSPLTGKPWTRKELDDFNTQYANWEPEYDEHGKQLKAKYDADNPIRAAIRNKTGIELPFGSYKDSFTDPKYNPTMRLPKLINDPNADLVKQAQQSRMDVWQARKELERAQAELDKTRSKVDQRKPNIK